MGIIPDTKNWTWVLERPCPECGFDASAFPREQAGAMTRENASLWPNVLARPGVRERPHPAAWSPLEYAAHVRDVLRIFDVRFALMLAEDGPAFANWDQDATAVEERYDQQDPAVVAEEIIDAAQALAARLDAVRGEQWDRTGFRSDGSRFTVESLARYFVHDPIHHLHDVHG